ncbi:Crp/Fnr family transcriptional regulator [Neoroseomonas oryzicola]|uniref:Crp/Fnr family transcriptional regulator n=1 Tax=Neoroseomonas oryzicola TaxID=535904 RepID=A0A9X9WNY0_9PROT|nr:Crp/Fnr family transcriptional regulator [Neoroseomonas oryzicola]MBR0662040.1 Crp/Fnr family transcriptional regulator [Neoroseomonas oryzicola]NKE18125.1 Crp/Fnr family transcriptional regulator [Neoroseomonas oryzicola]
MERDEAGRILLASGWLARQPPAVSAAVMRRARPVPFQAGEHVFHADDAPGGIYGIAAGAIGILVATGGRAPRLAHILRQGAWFGHGPLMTGGRRALGFRAMEPSVTLHIPLAALDELSRASLEGARSLAVLANANMGVAIATVSDLLIARADRRIAAVLLRATGAAQGVPPTDAEGYRLTQAELADMANASRQVVNRTLAGFARQGWIASGYQRIAIRDAAALAAFATPPD